MRDLRKILRRWRRRIEARILPEEWHLQREIRRTHRAYEPSIAAAAGAQRQDLIGELYAVLEEDESALARLQTRKWERLAQRYYVNVPPRPPFEKDNEFWSVDRWSGGHVLTDEGKNQIRRYMRDELTWRRDRWASWATMLIGLLTAGAAFLGAWLGSN
jgi:hypothetical protein